MSRPEQSQKDTREETLQPLQEQVHIHCMRPFKTMGLNQERLRETAEKQTGASELTQRQSNQEPEETAGKQQSLNSTQKARQERQRAADRAD